MASVGCGQFTKSAQSRSQLTFYHLQDQHDYDMYKRNGLTRSFFIILQQILIKYSRVSILIIRLPIGNSPPNALFDYFNHVACISRLVSYSNGINIIGISP